PPPPPPPPPAAPAPAPPAPEHPASAGGYDVPRSNSVPAAPKSYSNSVSSSY
uniref:Uncharacterized protein n=1 Tax=Panagrolaimus sp. PS1159 TaxID=55785 RepID=A0AC35F160_9BILA